MAIFTTMRYYAARKTIVGDIWRWTCRHDDYIYVASPCTEECQHTTKEEAERHYYEHGIANLRTMTFEHWEQCAHPECQAGNEFRTLTNKMLGEFGNAVRGEFLCDKHRNEVFYRQLHPFKPGITIMQS